MIKNKAIVNEENSDAEYWRKKYLALVKANQGGPKSSLSSLNSSSMVVDKVNGQD